MSEQDAVLERALQWVRDGQLFPINEHDLAAFAHEERARCLEEAATDLLAQRFEKPGREAEWTRHIGVLLSIRAARERGGRDA